MKQLKFPRGAGGPSLKSGIQKDQDRFRPNQEMLDSTRIMVIQSQLFHDAGADRKEWWDEIIMENLEGNGRDDRASTGSRRQNPRIPSCSEALRTTISLLEKLPNLRVLQLPSGWYDRESRRSWEVQSPVTKATFKDMTDALVASSRCTGKGLSKLEYILSSGEKSYNSRHDMQCLEPFMRLPSLKELYTTSCIAINAEDEDGGIPFTSFPESLPGQQSALRRMDLPYGCFDAAGLSTVLAYTHNLEVFRYGHESKWHGCEHDWNAASFIATLAQQCGQTLTDVAITLDDHTGDIINGVTSFCAFIRLRNLEFDIGVLHGPSLNSGHDYYTGPT